MKIKLAQPNKNTFGIWMILALLLLIFLPASYFTVKTGEVAAVTRFGKLVRIADEGLHFKFPFIDSRYAIEIREVLEKGTYSVSSRDMQTVETDIAIQYSVADPEKIFINFNQFYKERLVKPRTSEVVQAITSKYTIEELVSKRQQLSVEIYHELKDDLDKYGILLNNVSIINHDFSDAFEKAIEAKKVAEQETQAKEIRNQQDLRNTENQAKIRKIEAEANFEVKKLEAKANDALASSLNANILQKMYLDKWDGKLPLYQGEANMMISPKN